MFLAGALTLTLATILANVELAKAQAAKGVSINQTTADGRTVSAYFAEADKKDAPVKPMQRSLPGWIGPRPMAMTKLLRLAGVLEVVGACQPH